MKIPQGTTAKPLGTGHMPDTVDLSSTELSLEDIGIYTSGCSFSLEGEGWDEGDSST